MYSRSNRKKIYKNKKKETLLPLTINKCKIITTFILVENLNEDCILGNDFLDTHKADINYEECTIVLHVSNKKEKVFFTTRISETHTYLKPMRISNPRLNALLDEYSDIFRREPGLIKGYTCVIRFKTTDPINQRPYPILAKKVKAVEAEVERMLKLKIIERSNHTLYQ